MAKRLQKVTRLQSEVQGVTAIVTCNLTHPLSYIKIVLYNIYLYFLGYKGYKEKYTIYYIDYQKIICNLFVTFL